MSDASHQQQPLLVAPKPPTCENHLDSIFKGALCRPHPETLTPQARGDGTL